MEARNQIRMKILSDGTISINTDNFDEETHHQAEDLINETIELAGGERKIIENKDKDHHHHHHHGVGGHIHH